MYSIPIDRIHILGHSDADPSTAHKGCPNAVWDWGYFIGLITSASCYPMPAAAEVLAYGASAMRAGENVRNTVRNGAARSRATNSFSAQHRPSARPLEVVQLDYAPSSAADALKKLLEFQRRYQQWIAGVSETSFFPNSAICQLVRDDGGAGTGSYIGPDRIITAAHVVQGANSITVIPGKNGGTSLNGPFGTFTVSSSDWTIHPRYNPASRDFDLAVIVTSTPPPNGQYFDILEELRQSLPSSIIVCGYSAQSDDSSVTAAIDPERQHLDGDYIRTVGDETFEYNLQTLRGASGSPVYYAWGREDDERQMSVVELRLVGVHVAGFSGTLNRGCRLTDEKIKWIRAAGAGVSSSASGLGYYGNGQHFASLYGPGRSAYVPRAGGEFPAAMTRGRSEGLETEDALTRAKEIGPDVVKVVEGLKEQGVSDTDIVAFLDQIGAGSSEPVGSQASAMTAHSRALGEGVKIVLPGAYSISGWKASLLRAALAAQATVVGGPLGGALVYSLSKIANSYNVTIGFGPSIGAGLLAGGSLGVGIVFSPGDVIGFYGAMESSQGLIASISATIQVTIVKGGIGNFAGESYAIGFSAGEEIVGGAALLMTTSNEFQGVSFQLGIGASLSPIDVYISAQKSYATSQGLGYTRGVAGPLTPTRAFNGASGGARMLSDQVSDALPLSLKEFDYSEDLGDVEDLAHTAATATGALTNEEIYRIVREVAVADSGDALYGAVLTDQDYIAAGVQPKREFGLAFGLVLFTQESGRLGSVLRLMQQRDPASFAEIFGPDAQALLTTTNASTAAERLMPVAGEPLSGPTWIERFRRSGAVPAFQAAQNEEAIEGQFRPMLRVVSELGFTTDRSLAVVYDRVVTQGLGGGLRSVVQSAGPLRTLEQRNHALAMLGFTDLTQFQFSTGWVTPNGRFTPETHAALVGALRRQGAATLPLPDELASRVYRATTGPGKRRLRRLLDATAFTDLAYVIES